ncbi:SpoVR family protein [Oceanimonas sp. NS1]|nr:SpoVR family protein [Oceanimonas sp. NS1]
MFQDLRRICEQPTEEDKAWFPDIAGSDWVKTLHFAMENFKDEFRQPVSFPKVMRDFHLFAVADDDTRNYLEISAIHDESGYRALRQTMSNQYNLSNLEPNIQVYNVEVKGDRSLTLRHVPHNRIPLSDSCHEVIKHVHRLWGFDVLLEQEEADGSGTLLSRCPTKQEPKA